MRCCVVVLGLLTTASHAEDGKDIRLPLDVQTEPKPAARGTPLVIDRELPAAKAPDGAAELRIRLVAVDLSGNTKFSTERLAPLWQDMLGKEVSLADVFALAERITRAYRDAGYVLSQALVPRQDIDQSAGHVQIRVAEGYIAQVQQAPADNRSERIDGMLGAATAEKPLAIATLERELLLINDLPGVHARAVLKAAQQPDAANIDLLVDRTRSSYALSVDNRTALSVGPLRIQASAEHNGLFGEHDDHQLRWIGSGSERLNLLAYSGSAPVGYSGASVFWSASASRAKPASGSSFQLDTRSDDGALGVAYPVVRSRAVNLSVRGDLAAYDGSTDVAQGNPLSDERLRTLSVGMSADATDDWGGVNLVDLEARKGLSILGASRTGDASLTRAGSTPQFSKETLYAARLQSLGGETSLLLAMTGQQSNDLLNSSEQFSLGGETFLRAFDASELLGDRGIAGKLELRDNFMLGAASNTAYLYWDKGAVSSHQLDGSQSGMSASSTGIGIRTTATHGLRGYIEIAKPGQRPTARYHDERARVFAGLGIDLP